MYADGTPFFYLGDTAWELFHRLNREEAEKYLENRKAKHFNVIQAVILSEINGITESNAYGQLPFVDKNPLKPNEEYFKHVDYIIDKAGELDLFIGLLPAWGNHVYDKGIFHPDYGSQGEEAAKEKAYAYGEFLGKRYGSKRNIIWILGGDRVADGVEDIWRQMAKGIKDNEKYDHLMSFHPKGYRSSAEWFHEDSWLDFNIFQTGHGKKNEINYRKIYENYLLTPVKPIMEGEPNYEGIPVKGNPQNGWFDQADVRKAAYWGIFAGGFGHTYGAHSIWQMYDKGRTPITHVQKYWHEALDLPGAFQMQHLRTLMESRPFFTRIPDQKAIVSGQFSGAKNMQATRDKNGSYIMIYIPEGDEVMADTGLLSGSTGIAYWYNPREGTYSEAGSFENKEAKKFVPPSSGTGKDWVLILEDAGKKFTPPGRKAKEEN